MSNGDVATRLYDAFGSGDVPTVLSRLDGEIEWNEAEGSPHVAGDGGWNGPDDVVGNFFRAVQNER